MNVEAFESLKSWHLARLRMLAHENQSYSPSGLIESDHELLNRIAAAPDTPDQSSDKNELTERQNSPVSAVLLAISLLQIAIAILLPASAFKFWLIVLTLVLLALLILRRPTAANQALMKTEAANFDTTQKLLQELKILKESETLTVEYSRELLFILSLDLQIISVNQSFLKFFSSNKEETLGAGFSSFVTAGQTERLISSFEKCRLEQSALQIEVPVQNAAGRRYLSIYAEWSASNAGFFCEAVDISAAKELEQVKQSFISMISHDLRAPLQSMEVAIDLLLAGRFGQFQEQATAKLEVVQSSLHRLMRLTSDLLDLDKMQAGQIQIAKTKVESAELLQAAQDAVSELARKKDVKLSFSCELPSINCDQERMVQVLVNLLSNAIKYTPPVSNVSVLIRSAGKYAEIIVADEGPGIAEDFAAEIFELYRQIPGKEKQKGFGLGLSISKALVELHGGKIGLSPSSQKGAVFWIRIPKE